MERLTRKNKVNKLNKYQCKGLDMTCTHTDCDECNHMHEIVDMLGHYEDLAEQGRLVVLSCKVGDTILGKMITKITIDENGTFIHFSKCYGTDGYIGLTTDKLNITKTHLCKNCMNNFAECKAKDIIWGNGVGNDNVVMCDCYKAEQTLAERKGNL